MERKENAQRGVQSEQRVRGRRNIESTEKRRISREVRENAMSIQMANLEALPHCDIKTKEKLAPPRM